MNLLSRSMKRLFIAMLAVVLATSANLTPPASSEAHAVSEPKLNVTSKILAKGKTFSLKVKNAGNKKVVWRSSDKKIAKVSSKGKVTGVKVGKAIIKAKIGKRTLKCKVTVSVSKAKAKKALLVYAKSVNWKNEVNKYYREIMGSSYELSLGKVRYAYIDLNKDGLPEMIVSVPDDTVWHHSFLLRCDAFGKVTRVKMEDAADPVFDESEIIYSFGPVRLGSGGKTLAYNPVRNSMGSGGVCVVRLSGNKIAIKANYAWERFQGVTCYSRNNKEISKKTFDGGTKANAIKFKTL